MNTGESWFISDKRSQQIMEQLKESKLQDNTLLELLQNSNTVPQVKSGQKVGKVKILSAGHKFGSFVLRVTLKSGECFVVKQAFAFRFKKDGMEWVTNQTVFIPNELPIAMWAPKALEQCNNSSKYKAHLPPLDPRAANILRVPVARKVRDAIVKLNLTLFSVPQKWFLKIGNQGTYSQQLVSVSKGIKYTVKVTLEQLDKIDPVLFVDELSQLLFEVPELTDICLCNIGFVGDRFCIFDTEPIGSMSILNALDLAQNVGLNGEVGIDSDRFGHIGEAWKADALVVIALRYFLESLASKSVKEEYKELMTSVHKRLEFPILFKIGKIVAEHEKSANAPIAKVASSVPLASDVVDHRVTSSKKPLIVGVFLAIALWTLWRVSAKIRRQ